MSIYSCHNKPRPTADSSYIAQSGWKVWQKKRVPVQVVIKSAFGTLECQYTKDHAGDTECAGCEHKNKEIK